MLVAWSCIACAGTVWVVTGSVVWVHVGVMYLKGLCDLDFGLLAIRLAAVVGGRKLVRS